MRELVNGCVIEKEIESKEEGEGQRESERRVVERAVASLRCGAQRCRELWSVEEERGY